MSTPIAIIAGVGSGAGTGAAVARLLAKRGYTLALVARNADSLSKFADELKGAGGKAVALPVASYSYDDVTAAFESLPAGQLRVAIYNAGDGVWKPFLQVTPSDIQKVTQSNIEGAFAFANAAITRFKANEIDDRGKRGTLIFTGATASLRGNTTTSVFSAGKFALRALSQSLSKEFGKENVHVAHAVIDGVIVTGRNKERRNDPEWEKNADIRLDPEDIAEAYLGLLDQRRSAWTWELDLRPAHEKW
ncbi:short-chain dehydrogenase/reductase SDR [Hymenopellis radicata]|nr:short-chain dehydrogenase/reductase SDR [Hymenopellis radicata]